MSRPPTQRLLGEWAGWCCSFDLRSGAVKPVPSRYVSDEMIEWGQVPNGFEELTTETWESGALARRVVRLLPEQGCNIENLGALVSRESWPYDSLVAEQPAASAASAPAGEPGLWQCETIFDGLGGVRPRDRGSALVSVGERTRVTVHFDANEGRLWEGAPIVVRQERCWSADAGQLEVNEAVGSRSGLDAAWVDKAVGLGCFGDKKAPAGHALPGGVVVAVIDGGLEVALDKPDEARCVLRRSWAARGAQSEPEVSADGLHVAAE